MSLFRRRIRTDRPLSCDEVGRVLQQYLDEEAPADVAARVEEHLEDCRRCGLELDVYQRITTTLADRTPTLPPDALDRLRRFGEQLANGDDSSGPVTS
ncbi:MAG TPA: zf-HC2 domain-containing protein [Acidimicrobiales bacterium]|nr:zf-HC2 domain-containing protein [Acidimicrobiales bacterium]